jgi:Flp pilus assembly protein TadG
MLGSTLRFKQQQGAIAVAYLIMSILLLGFIGLGLDVGRLYIAKTELQNASDACALAASAALTGASTNQLQVAEDWAIATATRNLVGLQATPVSVTANSSVTFSDTLDGTYSARSAITTSTAILAKKYARCTVNEAGINSILLKVMRLIEGPTAFAAKSVQAAAVANLQPSISNCALPIAACTVTSSGPNFGLDVGRWYKGRIASGSGQTTGAFRWVSFPGASSGVPALGTLLSGTGQCNLNAATQVASQNGAIASLAADYNGRFGSYKGGNPNNLSGTPDFTGYPYYPPVAVPVTQYVYPLAPTAPTSAFADFQARRASNAPLQNVPNFTEPGGWNHINGTGTAPSHQALGSDRRLVTMPFADCSSLAGGGNQTIKGWGCFLMLNPIFNPNDDQWLEFRGNATSISAGCVTSGLPGGPSAGGPKVPGLAQ